MWRQTSLPTMHVGFEVSSIQLAEYTMAVRVKDGYAQQCKI